MNQVNLVGRVADEIKVYGSGKGAFLPLTIAVDGYYDKKKEENVPYFIEVKLFGQLADRCQKLLKGSLIRVTGYMKPNVRKKVNKDTGEVIGKEYTQDIIVEYISFLAKPKGNGGVGNGENR